MTFVMVPLPAKKLSPGDTFEFSWTTTNPQANLEGKVKGKLEEIVTVDARKVARVKETVDASMGGKVFGTVDTTLLFDIDAKCIRSASCKYSVGATPVMDMEIQLVTAKP